MIAAPSNAIVPVEVGDDATVLLAAVEQGDPEAPAKLLELLYTELRHLAASKMAREAPGQTLQPTALVHEAWLRLVGATNMKFENRAQFFSAAAEAMRRILIDRARRKLAQRHGGGHGRRRRRRRRRGPGHLYDVGAFGALDRHAGVLVIDLAQLRAARTGDGNRHRRVPQ